MSSTHLRRQSILMNPKAPEVEKKVAALVYNDKTDGMSSKDLHTVAAFTFNPGQCDMVYKVLGNSVDPNNNTWQTILKALVMLDHLVCRGTWRHARALSL